MEQFAEFEIHFYFNDKSHYISPSVAFALYDFIEELEKECKRKEIEIKISLDEEGGLIKKILFISSILATAHLSYIQDITYGFWTEISGQDGKELGKQIAKKISNIFENADKDNKTIKIEADIKDKINNKKIKYCSIEKKDFHKYFDDEENNKKKKNKKLKYQVDDLEITQSGNVVLSREAQKNIKNTNEYKEIFAQFENKESSYEEEVYFKGSMFKKEV